MLLEFINDAKQYRDKYQDEYQQAFTNPVDCDDLISKDMVNVYLENSEMLEKAKLTRESIINDLNRN